MRICTFLQQRRAFAHFCHKKTHICKFLGQKRCICKFLKQKQRICNKTENTYKDALQKAENLKKLQITQNDHTDLVDHGYAAFCILGHLPNDFYVTSPTKLLYFPNNLPRFPKITSFPQQLVSLPQHIFSFPQQLCVTLPKKWA